MSPVDLETGLQLVHLLFRWEGWEREGEEGGGGAWQDWRPACSRCNFCSGRGGGQAAAVHGLGS